MAVDNSYQPSIYKEMGGNKLVIKAAGTIEVESGATITGLAPTVPASNGKYVLQITSGVATWVAETP